MSSSVEIFESIEIIPCILRPMVELRPYTNSDFFLLQRGNTEEQKRHVGGPENEEKLLKRHKRYAETQEPGKFRMFVIMFQNQSAGHVGYWQREWQGHSVY